jgi:hypothetical protein
MVSAAYCSGLACAERALVEATTGWPFKWFIACVSWKSSTAPNSKGGGAFALLMLSPSLSASLAFVVRSAAFSASAADVVARSAALGVSRWPWRLASRMLDRQIARLIAVENSAGVDAGRMVRVR